MKLMVLTTVLTAVVLLGIPLSCQKEDLGAFIVSGKVIDKHTREGIPDMRIKVDGVIQFGLARRKEAGNTVTNTDGTFTVAVENIENAAFYEFFANWESLGYYTEGTDFHGDSYLDSITKNNIPMLFELSKIEPLQINLRSIAPFNDDDYTGLHFYSDTMGFPRVKTVENYGIGNLNYESAVSDDGTRTEWVGSNVNSVINANILANEKLTIIVTIRRNGQLKEVIRVVNGKRDETNNIYIDF